MNYDEIKELALSYADRQDQEVIDRMDNFTRMVEVRLNRLLKIQDSEQRAILELVEETDNEGNVIPGREYYGLPLDFAGLKDVEVRATFDSQYRETVRHISAEQLNNIANLDSDYYYYNIVAGQLQIIPRISKSMIVEIVYNKRLPPLGALNSYNWLSAKNPDVYVFGLLVEISAFTKDAEAGNLWNERFLDTVNSLQLDDWRNSNSGPALQIRAG